MTRLDRYYLQSDPSAIVKANAPARVTLWVPKTVDMEEEDFVASRVYVALDENTARLWKGTPLMFEMFHTFNLDAGKALWACTRDQALIGIQIDPIQ